MPQPDIYLSIIIPTYNEVERIEKTLRRFNEYLFPQPYPYEIFVVDDGSRDATADVVTRLSAEIKNLRLMRRKENKGKGYTVREGMLAARGKIRLFADADNATDISHIEKMRPFFDWGYDVVIASRNPKDVADATQAISQSWWKRALGNMGNWYIQWSAISGIWDTQCGFKAFRNHAAEKLFGMSRIDRWAFDVEILALAKKCNFKIGIIPARWINDPKTHVKFSGYLRSLWEVYKISRDLKHNKYQA